MKPKFSDRMGLTHLPTVVQLDSMTEALRNSIWNLLVGAFSAQQGWMHAARQIAVEFLKRRLDDVPDNGDWHARRWLGNEFSNLKWEEVYNLLEFVVENADRITKGRWTSDQIVEGANLILEREFSGYRFVGGELTRISNQAEIEAIEEAISRGAGAGLEGVQTHITKSLHLLGLRPDPDYLNSIKEAISAVESAVNCISGMSGGGVADALKALSQKVEIHGALRKGLVKLYGYTSDEDGIRHAILEQPNVGYDEAKFMVVACSAFVNFLISKAEAVGLLTADRE